jgi:type IV pilus assembly protein PilE
MKKNNRGFTMLELMIVVTIIAILAAIAYPNYQGSLVKGTRGAAKAFLLEVAQKQQQFLLDNRSYASKAELQAVKVDMPKEVSDYYTWTVTPLAGPPPTFTTTLTPIATKRMKDDGTLTIDQTGAKTSSKPNKW